MDETQSLAPSPDQMQPQSAPSPEAPSMDMTQQEAELNRQLEANQKVIEQLQRELNNYQKIQKVLPQKSAYKEPTLDPNEKPSEGVLSDPNAQAGGGKQDPFAQFDKDGKLIINLNNEGFSGKEIEGSDGSLMDNLRLGAESVISGLGSGTGNFFGEAAEGLVGLANTQASLLGVPEQLRPKLEVMPAVEQDNIPFTLTDSITRFVVGMKLMKDVKPLKAGPVGNLYPGFDTAVNTAKAGANLSLQSGITQFLAFDKNDGNLSNFANEFLSQFYIDFGDAYIDLGGLKNPVTDFLMAKQSDTETVARLKGTLENFGMDGALAAVFSAGAQVVKRGQLLQKMFGNEAAAKYISNTDKDKTIDLLSTRPGTKPSTGVTKEGASTVSTVGGRTQLNTQLEHTNYSYNQYGDGTVTPVTPKDVDGAPSVGKFESTSETHIIDYTKKGTKDAASSAQIIDKGIALQQAQKNLSKLKADESSYADALKQSEEYGVILTQAQDFLKAQTTKSAEASAQVMEFYMKAEDDYFNVLEEVSTRGFDLTSGPNSMVGKIETLKAQLATATDPLTQRKIQRELRNVEDLRARYGESLKALKESELGAVTGPNFKPEFNEASVAEAAKIQRALEKVKYGQQKLIDKFKKLDGDNGSLQKLQEKIVRAEAAVERLQGEFDSFSSKLREFKPAETTVVKGSQVGTQPVAPPKVNEVEKFLNKDKTLNTEVLKRQLKRMSKEEFGSFFNNLDDAGKKRLKKVTGC